MRADESMLSVCRTFGAASTIKLAGLFGRVVTNEDKVNGEVFRSTGQRLTVKEITVKTGY